MALGNRIRYYREKAGLTLEQLSERSGVEVGTISALENRDSSRSKFATFIARGLGMSVEMLEDETHDFDVATLLEAPPPSTMARDVDLSAYGAVPMYHAPDAVIVPILSNCGSMGPGAELLESDVIVGDLALSPHWINQHIRPQNPRELRFIHAYGDSMAPTFTDGDVLLVDTGASARDPSSREGVYVLRAHDKNFIKRVTPTFDGKMQVTSDNPSSKTVQTLNGDHQVDVVGRVVWAWNGKRL